MVKDLPHGFEFQPRRRIYRPTETFYNRGCYIETTTADGRSTSIAMESSPYSSYPDRKVWLEGDSLVECFVDFIPDSHREFWTQITKLGRCYLAYDPVTDSWTIVFPENPILNFPSDHARSQSEAIETLIYRYLNGSIIYNGDRWFDCRDLTNFKKISDDEAKKLQNEIAGT
jgi:hypothetical protein